MAWRRTVVTEKSVRWLFRTNAIINWALAVRMVVDPQGMSQMFGGPAPNYPFIVRLWGGFVFMFGCMFWEISRNVYGKRALVKYNWIEKTITGSAVAWGWAAGEAPLALMGMIVITNWIWIPVLIYVDLALRPGRPADRATA